MSTVLSPVIPENLISFGPSDLRGAQQKEADAAAERLAHQPEMDALSGYDAAMALGPTAYLFRQWDRHQIAWDPNFTITEDALKHATVDLDTKFWPDLAEAHSQAELDTIREQAFVRQTAERKMGTLGWTGVPLSLASGIMDPAAFATFAATAGVGEAVGLGGLAGRMGAAVRGGIIAGTGNAAVEAYLATQDRTKTAEDVLYAGAVGAILGSTVGALTHGQGSELSRKAHWDARIAARSERLARTIEYGDIKKSTGQDVPAMTPTGETRYADDIAGVPVQEAWNTIQDAHDAVTTEQSASELAAKQEVAAARAARQVEATAARESLGAWGQQRTAEIQFQDSLDAARGRLVGIDPAKRLNRSEVDSILEGTGLKANNQGFPTPDELGNRLLALKHGVGIDNVPRVEQSTSVQIQHISDVAATNVPPNDVTGFKTSKGSSYAVHGDSTTRTKSFHPEHGSADVGLKDPSQRTVYVGEEAQSEASLTLGLNKESEPSVTLEGDELVVRYKSGKRKNAAGDWELIPREKRFPVKTTPEIGQAPIEFWPGGNVHVGNDITEVTGTPQKGDSVSVYGHPGTVTGHTATGFPEVKFESGHSEAVPPGDVKPVPPEHPVAGMGAASAETTDHPQERPRGPKLPNDPNLSGISTAKGSRPLGIPGGGTTDILVQSPSVTDRIIGRGLGNEVVPDVANSPVPFSGGEYTRMEYERRKSAVTRSLDPIFDEWAAERGGRNALNEGAYLNSFLDEVTRAQADKPGAYTDNPHINKAANRMRQEYADLLEYGKRNQVPGFAGIPSSEQYAPSVLSKANVADLQSRLKVGELERFVGEALVDHGKLTDKMRAALAKAKLNTERGRYTEVEASRMFDPELRETLRSLLLQNNVAEDVIGDTLNALRSFENENAGRPSSARSRIDFDENYQAVLEGRKTYGKDGTPIPGKPVAVRFRDILENNAFALHQRYSRQLVGHAFMQEMYRVLSPQDGPAIKTLDGLLREADRGQRAAGMDINVSNRNLRRIESLARSTLGVPQETGASPEFTTFSRLTRKLTNATLMGLAPFSHINNIASMVSEAGFESTMNALPSLGSLIREVTSGGKWQDDLLREFRAFGSIGDEPEVGAAWDHIERLNHDGTWVAPVEKMLDKAGQIQSKLTLFRHIVGVMRKEAVVLGEQKWLSIARTGKIPSIERLAGMGIDRARAEAITKFMLKYGETSGPNGSGRLLKARLDKWIADGPEGSQAAADFVTSIDKWSRRTAQATDPGQLSLWMTKPMGQLIIDKRNFHVGAINKQFRYNLKMRDWPAFFNVTNSMVVGGLAYMAREYASSIGRADREKYLKERFATSEIAKAAFARTGFFTLFPPAVDAIGKYTGLYSPQFNHTRSTGLETDPIFGNPTLNLLTSAYKIPRAIVAPLRKDYQFSQEDMRAIRSVTPLQNALGVRNWLDAIQTRLPPSSKVR